jgi:hypothetical protein
MAAEQNIPPAAGRARWFYLGAAALAVLIFALYLLWPRGRGSAPLGQAGGPETLDESGAERLAPTSFRLVLPGPEGRGTLAVEEQLPLPLAELPRLQRIAERFFRAAGNPFAWPAEGAGPALRLYRSASGALYLHLAESPPGLLHSAANETQLLAALAATLRLACPACAEIRLVVPDGGEGGPWHVDLGAPLPAAAP